MLGALVWFIPARYHKIPCHAETKNDLNREMGGPEQQYAHISVLQVGWLTNRP